MKIYVASSWRNEFQPRLVEVLKKKGYEVYDFRNPALGDNGFHWSEIDLEWQNWSTENYIAALQHPIAEAGFNKDFDAMQWADTFILVLPAGRSAHLELGWAVGAGKTTAIWSPTTMEPELMVKMVDMVTGDLAELFEWLEGLDRG